MDLLAHWFFESGGQKDVCLRGVCLSDRLLAYRKWTGCDGVVLVVGHGMVPSIDRAGLRFFVRIRHRDGQGCNGQWELRIRWTGG